MHLVATDLELGSVYIMGNTKVIRENQEICRKLEVPKDYMLIAGIAISYPQTPAEERTLVTDKIQTIYIK